MDPSAPSVIPPATVDDPGMTYPVIAPSVWMRPSWLPVAAAPGWALLTGNQTELSGPGATFQAAAPRFSVWRLNSVMLPDGVIRPILPAFDSENQRLPSWPTVIQEGMPLATVYSVSWPATVRRPIRLPHGANCVSVNHKAPSGPETIP